MSVVDRGGWVMAGRARRLLVRVLLVLGGALVVTGVGWLIGTASASAAVLPTVPVPPLTSVTDAIPAPPALPATVPTTLPTPALPSTPADLGQVAQQVHQAVSGFRDRVTPETAPVTVLAEPLVAIVSTPVNHVPTLAMPAIVTSVPSAQARPQTVLPHRHSVRPMHVRPRATNAVPAGAPQHRTPVLPPVQPAGSSDANAHTTGGSAGGAGGPQFPFVTLVGAAPHPVGGASAPRLPVAPGQQPGTSPD